MNGADFASQWVAAPIVVPLVTAVVGIALGSRARLQRVVVLAGLAASLVVSLVLGALVWRAGIQVLEVGGWTLPFGIALVADHTSVAMLAVSSLIVLAGAAYAAATLDPERVRSGYYPLIAILAAGISGAFVAGDLFNLYVWFEVILITSFVLLTLGGSREQLRGGVKYVAINLVASALLLTAVGLLYGMTGTLNLAELSLRVATLPAHLTTAVALLFVVALGIKAGLFPLFGWLPDAYPSAPIAVSAVFAGLLTKVGVYALVRLFSLLFSHEGGTSQAVLLVLAGLTMVTGVLGAAGQRDVRRILSWHVISQIGYMIMALALFTPLALVGLVFYVVHHIVVKTNLFLVSGLAERAGGSFSLERLGGLYRERPWLAALFFVPAFSLAGLPPLSGFWAKLVVIKASLDAGSYLIAAVALVVGALTLYSMSKIWVEAYWKPRPADDAAASQPSGAASSQTSAPGKGLLPAALPSIALAAITIFIGLSPAGLYGLAERASAELLDPAGYVAAVLGRAAP